MFDVVLSNYYLCKMDKERLKDVLRILKNGAEKPIDDLNDFCKGKSIGEIKAYAHALELIKWLFN